MLLLTDVRQRLPSRTHKLDDFWRIRSNTQCCRYSSIQDSGPIRRGSTVSENLPVQRENAPP